MSDEKKWTPDYVEEVRILGDRGNFRYRVILGRLRTTLGGEQYVVAYQMQNLYDYEVDWQTTEALPDGSDPLLYTNDRAEAERFAAKLVEKHG